MPLGEREGILIGTGTALVGATAYFYRQKQTLPFKVRFVPTGLRTLGCAVTRSGPRSCCVHVCRRAAISLAAIWQKRQGPWRRQAVNEELISMNVLPLHTCGGGL